MLTTTTTTTQHNTTGKQMPKPTRSIYRAQRHAVRALRRGDAAEATRWMEIMRDILSRARSENDLINHRPIPRPKPPKPAPLPPSMPVMLDPKGFSPGGQPNWFLNQQRLERAGLDRLPTPSQGQNRPGTSQRRTP